MLQVESENKFYLSAGLISWRFFYRKLRPINQKPSGGGAWGAQRVGKLFLTRLGFGGENR